MAELPSGIFPNEIYRLIILIYPFVLHVLLILRSLIWSSKKMFWEDQWLQNSLLHSRYFDVKRINYVLSFKVPYC